MRLLRIATRRSPLALWQAKWVAAGLARHNPGLETRLVEMTTSGDRIQDRPLATAGGKGLFLKELEHGLLEDEADIAVHSMKDVTVTLPDGLHIPVLCPREDPRDAFVSNRYASLDDMPAGAVVGTSSLRRQTQVKHRYPHLEVITLRGNVNTRLAKLDRGEFDAILLAVAGLLRLEMQSRIRQRIDPSRLLPAVGQGVMGIECRRGDGDTLDLIRCLNDAQSETAVVAERRVNAALDGGCQVPIAAYADALSPDRLRLRALVGTPDGRTLLTAEDIDAPERADELGGRVGQSLIDQGARQILDAVYAHG
ncbi:MAG: hydroxymethylbilane synthase [Gammaproteobacteria bacterium]|nr:hydroxymethylbilane synthase [Gammaproteobacteria bacterium]